MNRAKAKPITKSPPPRTAAAPARGPFISTVLPGLGLALLAMAVYAPTLRAGLIWDDNTLTTNPLLFDLKGLWRIWTWPSLMANEGHYWPLTYTTFWLERLIGGGRLNPALLHFDNLLLHAAAVVLLWRVLLTLGVPGAWLGAALFAVHPVHAESVAWIIERKDVLSGALYFGAALAYLRFDCGMNAMRNAECGIKKKGIQNSESRIQNAEPLVPRPSPLAPDSAFRVPHSTFYVLALVLFTLALLSKSIVVTLPAALALALWWRNGRLTRRDLLDLIPFLIIALLITAGDLNYGRRLQERSVEMSGLALPERILMAGGALWVYLSKLIWPHPLAMFYPTWPVSRAAFSSWLPLLGWVVLLPALWFARRRIGRGPLAAVAFFGLTLSPAIGIIDFEYFHYSWIADRFQYLASAGPLVLAGAGLAMLGGRLRWLGPVLLAVFGVLCLRQAALYHDSITFFRACVEAYPQCWPSHAKLSLELRQQKRFAEAVRACREGLKHMPDEYHLVQELAKALEQNRQFDEAEQQYKKALELKPEFANARIGYGLLLAGRGDLDGAMAQYRKYLEINPEDGVALNNLGTALRARHQTEEALEVFARAVSIRPQYLDCRYNYALVLLDAGRFAEAAGQCRQILAINADHPMALNALGVALMALQKPAEALPALTRAVELQPRSPDALYLLADAHAMLNHREEAIHYYRETLKVKPDEADALRRLQALGAGPQ